MSNTIQRHLHQRRAFRSLEEEVFVGLQLVADRVMEPWARYLREAADLTPAQYNVLRILRGAGEGGLCTGEIASRLITRSPDTTRLLDRLERQGMIRRCRGSEDRRMVRAHITPAGREQLSELDAVSRRMLHGALHEIGEQRLEQLRDLLGAILDASDPLQ